MSELNQLSFSSVDEVLQTAAFHRRNGCPHSDDASALKEALTEALAVNGRLAERAEDLDGLSRQVCDLEEEKKDAEDALECSLSKERREDGDSCDRRGFLDCAECRIARMRREHQIELEETRRAPCDDGRAAALDEQIAKLSASLEFVTEERNKFFNLLQRQEIGASKAATPKPKRAPKKDAMPLGPSLFELMPGAAPAEGQPKVPPKAKREKKRRLWLDARLPAKPARKPRRKA